MTPEMNKTRALIIQLLVYSQIILYKLSDQ